MNSLSRVLFGAARNLLSGRVLVIVLLPMTVAVLVWVGLAWWYWDSWVGWIHSLLVKAGEWWFDEYDVSSLASVAATILLILLLLPAVLASASLIAAVFAMPLLVEEVAKRDFPQLERRKGGTFLGSLWNAFAALGAFLGLWLLSLPAWLIAGPLAAVVPWLLSAYLNQRLFRYDALSEHATEEEMQRIFSERFGGLFTLGLITGALYFVPLVNLVAPVYAALAYTQYGLGELQRLRAEQGGAQVTRTEPDGLG
jgi:uncharacterized protein involved in cysteine biosynthesis